VLSYSDNLNEDLYNLSWMISVAVDFAKHGKCVEESKFKHIEEKCRQWPDYMDGRPSGKPVVQSEHILGKLYRQIDCKTLYKVCIEGDHDRSVLLNYTINWSILGDERTFRKDMIPIWHQYLRFVFKEYVVPLEEELQKIMVQYKILNEGELFCTTLMFNLDDESNSKFIGDPGKKDDDAVKQLN